MPEAETVATIARGFTNAMAFSPTDVMPLVPRARVAMAVQSLISLMILGLVVARAVNIFT